MGRPPCCDKVGIKKGPWTPEEDIILVSYIQEHGPGNWRSVPTNTGLLRCSKSCRLRWTNYLRPGIKRGNFTPHEEGMIIHLQALLGNKWAAIASYLPQRTDNDIKNYWNTHLKKKIKKFQTAFDPHVVSSDSTASQFVSKSFIDHKRSSSSDISSHYTTAHTSSTYASSTENISRLLEGWMRASPKNSTQLHQSTTTTTATATVKDMVAAASTLQCYRPKAEQDGGDLISHEEFESILSFDNLNTIAWDKSDTSAVKGSSSTTTTSHHQLGTICETDGDLEKEARPENNNPPFSVLEKWLLDETAGQVEELMELSPMF